MVVGYARNGRLAQVVLAHVLLGEGVVDAFGGHVLHQAHLVRGDAGFAGTEEVVPSGAEVGVVLDVVDLENVLGAGLLRGEVPDRVVGDVGQFAERPQVPCGGELFDGRSERRRLLGGEILVAGVLQFGLAVERPRGGLACTAALRCGLHVGQRAAEHVVEVGEDRLVDLALRTAVVVGLHLVLGLEFGQDQGHVAPLGHQMEIGQRAQEADFGFVGVARVAVGIAHVVQMREQRVGPRNGLEELRVTVVHVGVLLGKRIVVELVGNAAVGAAVRHGRVMRADVGEVVVVRVVVALRERRIDAVERGDDVGFGLVEVADRRGVGVVFVEESAGRRRDRGGEQDEHMFDLHIRTRFRKLSLNRPNRCARGGSIPSRSPASCCCFYTTPQGCNRGRG